LQASIDRHRNAHPPAPRPPHGEKCPESWWAKPMPRDEFSAETVSSGHDTREAIGGIMMAERAIVAGAPVYMYRLDHVPSVYGGKLGAVLALNPMTHLIDAFRAVLLDQRMPGMAFHLTFAASILMLAGAWVMFHLAEFDFAENL